MAPSGSLLKKTRPTVQKKTGKKAQSRASQKSTSIAMQRSVKMPGVKLQGMTGEAIQSAREQKGLANAVQLSQAPEPMVAMSQARRDTFPWDGEVIAPWSATLRKTPSKDPADPHANTEADLPKGHKVKVLSITNGWLKVETKVGTATKTGYVSQELIGLAYEASTHVVETITNAPRPAWNGTYSWDSRFRLIFAYDKKSMTARINLYSTATATQKAAWKTAVEGKWSGQKKLQVIEDAAKPQAKDLYKINVEIVWVDSAADAHQTVNPSTPGSTSGGRAGQGGTTSMTDWGTSDTVDVTHEFGHMLGNKEDYFTIDGVAHGAARQTGKGIMNNPAEYPFSQHYETIRTKAATALNVPDAQCTITN